MPADHLFADDRLAALYDLFAVPGDRDDFAFYAPMIMAAPSVLDVGCGTGVMLHRAREAGHTGRLCGLDPAPGMLKQAQRRTDIEWVLGDLASVRWDREFDLAVMTGHAFQVLLTDDDVRTALAAVYAALTEGGRFAFETRNPPDRAWERWHGQSSGEVRDASGVLVRRQTEVDAVAGDLVSFRHTFSSERWERPEVSTSTLRFLGGDALAGFLAAAGFQIEEQFGDWDRSPVTDTSPEIITIARRV